jgi:tyrosyl-tRNA synthetase
VPIAELTRNAVDVLPEGGLEAKLKLGRPLRVKLGIDPTGPDIHLGFAVVLRRLRAFQDAGHVAVLIVGDYTARIGDPSGRSKERQVLPDEVLDANATLFAEQAFRILDRGRTEIRFNGEWLGKLDYAELVRLTRTGTVARLLERDDFEERFEAGNPISVSELLYPFAQGYDSVAIEADIEVGGTDQLYNLLMGRDVMAHYGFEPQSVITFELLVGTDGAIKMSKSERNYIGIDEAPNDQFGKVMSIPDEALRQWWRLCLEQEAPEDVDAFESKLALARGIVTQWHGEEAAREAEEYFDRVVRRRETPEDIKTVRWMTDSDPVYLPSVFKTHFNETTSHWRRVIDQGGVTLDGRVVSGYEVPWAELDGAVLQAGKRRFLRLTRG